MRTRTLASRFDSISYDWDRDRRLAEREKKIRENFDAMIAPSLANARPKYPKQRQQRQPNMKYFGIRGFHG